MKIPTILAQAEIPEGAPYPRASAAGQVAGYEALAQAGREIGRAGEIYAQVERQKAALATRLEADKLKSQFELETGTLLTNLETIEQDPDRFAQRYEQGTKDILKKILDQAQRPETKERLQAHLPRVLASQGVQVAKKRNELFIGSVAASLSDTLHNRRVAMANALPGQTLIAGGDEPGTAIVTDAWQHHLEQGLATIESAGAVLGVKAATKERQEFIKGALVGRAEQSLRLNPDADISRFVTALDMSQREHLVKMQGTLQNARARRLEKQERDAEKATEDQRKVEYLGLVTQARDGLLTEDAIQGAITSRVIQSKDDEQHLRTILKAEARDSDATVLRVFSNDIHGERPTTTDAQIRQANLEWAQGRPGLSTKDAAALQNTLLERQRFATQQTDTEESRRHRDQHEDYTARLREGRQWLGLVTMFEKLDPISEKLIAQYESDFNARVLYLNKTTGKPARDVNRDLLPRYLAAQSRETRLSFEVQWKTLDPRYVSAPPADPLSPAFEVWFFRTKATIDALATTQPDVAFIQKQGLMNLWDQRRLLLNTAERMKGFKESEGATSGARPSGRTRPTPMGGE